MDIRLKIDFPIKPADAKMKHGDRCVLIGSCFSNEMGSLFEANGFDVLSNPLGTIFHPVPIARILSDVIQGNEEEQFFQRQDLYFSKNAGGTIFGLSETQLKEGLDVKRTLLLNYLQHSRYLFVTFGSAFGYRENISGEIVANCHKMPSYLFVKELTELNIMFDSWSKALDMIHTINPDLQVLFTVSPVRHAKDGIAANSRSKSRLFELISLLEEKQNVSYFPSYEIVTDELRDYRFYKEDGLHPNEQAVQYVWGRLKEFLFGADTIKLCEEIMSLRRRESHCSLYAGSIADKQFGRETAASIRHFLDAHPEVKWK